MKSPRPLPEDTVAPDYPAPPSMSGRSEGKYSPNWGPADKVLVGLAANANPSLHVDLTG